MFERNFLPPSPGWWLIQQVPM